MVLGQYNNLRWSGGEQVNVVSLVDISGTNSLLLEERQAWMAWEGKPKPGARDSRRPVQLRNHVPLNRYTIDRS